MMPRTLLTLLLLSLAAIAPAATVKDREDAVRGDKAKLENDPRWNWNDIDGGFRLALDGEAVPYGPLQAEVHGGLLRVFG